MNIYSREFALTLVVQVWITQKEFRNGFDSIDSYTAAIIMSFLFNSRRILSQMSALMIFTATLKFIDEIDFRTTVNYGDCNLIPFSNEKAFYCRFFKIHHNEIKAAVRKIWGSNFAQALKCRRSVNTKNDSERFN